VLVYLVMLLIVPEEPLEGTSSPPVQEQAEPESSTKESEGED